MLRLRCLAAPALAATVARRFVKSSDNTYEDDRWLEAEFQDVEKTVEERYAFEKQKEVMKKLLAKMREEHDKKLEAKHEEYKSAQTALHDEHVSAIKSEIEVMKEKLAKLESNQ